MKRFFLKLALFFSIVVCIDVGYGTFCDIYRSRVKSGMTNLDYTAARTTRADALIFGSSRARRNYDTRIIADSLGMTAFDCGYNSMGIEFLYFRLKQVLKRYSPRVIIYDVTPLFDLMESDSKNVNLRCFKPYFFEEPAYSSVRDIDFAEWVKCHAATYRLHGAVEDFMADDMSKEVFYDGYAPLDGIRGVKVQRHATMTVDPHKMALLEDFIRDCHARNIQLFFVLSPYYQNDMGDQGATLRPLAEKYGIPVIDHFNDPAYMNDTTLYWDASHLNMKGATQFTRTIASEIKPLLRNV